jgi:hypothetical protein
MWLPVNDRISSSDFSRYNVYIIRLYVAVSTKKGINLGMKDVIPTKVIVNLSLCLIN